MNCNHNICNVLISKLKNPNKGGAGCIILTKVEDKYVALLGYEKYGTKNKHKLNLATGGRNPSDNGCYIKCALRELNEEYKINLSETEFFKYFTDTENKVQYQIMGGVTPVFIGILPKIDINELNRKINYDNIYNTDPSYREMEFVDYVDIYTKKQIYNIFPESRISSFANSMINRLISCYTLY
jgi:hypothetical protein